MNSSIKNNKRFFSLLLGLLLHSTLSAFTFNNEPLDSIIQPGDALSLTFSEKNEFIALEMENGNLTTRHAYLDCLPLTREEAFKKNRDKCSRPVKLMSPVISKVVSYKASYLIGEQLNFESEKLLSFTNCLLESPSISITGDRMFFKDCFLINPQVLFLFINSPESNYQIIKIVFHDETKNPIMLSGSVDFLKLNKTPQILILGNVKKIIIEFNPQIWNN